ncbi:hypothetical protein LOK74_22830 [Brevibacillus humidisoli]|uniref:hypothetical protein n=1 Tax=Brevibacillus humidisoli TaxID=2895522 RepID=UPI001E41D7C6|nr:hypothetical protein [Brevibacillus humidisoli]UFJ40792.1 hypothetical protein LOK74_22830 [Brevibacillus humidisoli]
MFEPGTVWSWGPFTVPVLWMGMLVGIIGGYYLLARIGHKQQLPTVKPFLDTITSAALIGVLIYKLWPLVEQTDIFIRNPAALLLYSGGAYAAEAAGIASAGWFLYRGIRGKWLGWQAAEWLFAGSVLLLLSKAVFVKEYGVSASWGWELAGNTYIPLNLIDLVLYLSLLVVAYVFFVKKTVATRDRVGILLVGLGLAGLIRGLWRVPAADTLLWGMTLPELLLVAALLVGVTLLLLPKK